MGPIGQLSTGLQSLTLDELPTVEEADAVDPSWSFPIDREGHRIYYEDDPEEYEYWWHTGAERWRDECLSMTCTHCGYHEYCEDDDDARNCGWSIWEERNTTLCAYCIRDIFNSWCELNPNRTWCEDQIWCENVLHSH